MAIYVPKDIFELKDYLINKKTYFLTQRRIFILAFGKTEMMISNFEKLMK